MFKIAIPTHRRSDKIKELTLHAINGVEAEVYIFISDEEDYQKYKKEIPEYNLILCNTKTVAEKFNYIQTYFPEGEQVVVIEDDIKKIQNLYNLEVKDLFNYLYGFCQDNNVKAWGVYPSSNLFFMNKSIDTGLTYMVANLYGFTSKEDKELLCHLKTKNDYERSVKFFSVYKNIHRFNFISCVTNNYINKGGMQEDTDRKENELQASYALVDLYPNIFSINEGRKSKYTELKMKKGVVKTILDETNPLVISKSKVKKVKRHIEKPWLIL